MMNSIVLLFAVLSLLISVSLGFAPMCSRCSSPTAHAIPHPHSMATASIPRSIPTTALYAESEPDTGGLQRGIVLFAIVFAICVWGFTIPVEFRRARLCTAEEAEIYPQCYTASQWFGGIQEYYKGGGGIKFDFSIDPGTLEENEEFRKALMGQ